MRKPRRPKRESPPRASRIEARFDRRAAEGLTLEIAMLAKVHGLNVKQIEITVPRRTAKARRPRVRGSEGDFPGSAARNERTGA